MNLLITHYGKVVNDSNGGKNLTIDPPFSDANYSVNVTFQYINSPLPVGYRNDKTKSFCRIGCTGSGSGGTTMLYSFFGY